MAVATPSRSVSKAAALSIGRDMLAGIRRRKLLDAAFALLGLLLVTGSLSVLVLLFGQLVRDGSKRLVSGHLVNPNGFAPAIRDLVGTLKREGEGEPAQWILQRDSYTIVSATTILNEEQLRSLAGKPVIVSGDLPAPGQTKMEATTIEPADAPRPERFSRDNVHGTLRQQRAGWAVEPAPLPVDFGDAKANPETLAGTHVAITIGLSKSLPLEAKSLRPLVFQGFFNSMPSREPERAGIKSAIVGSLLVVSVTMILAVPLGVAAGVWLEEYGRKNWFTALIEINIANLAGVPSIVWGLMALGLLVYGFGFGRSIQTAGITLGLLVLPIVIIATREAIRSIPIHIREASYACGASKWQTVRYHVLPYSLSGILTGSIIGLSRAIGETAPLITIGAMTYIAYLPEFSWSNPFGWLRSGFTVLPIQMFNWVSRPDVAFQENAAAAGIILLGLTLSMNAAAIALRYRLRRRIKW
jgi:phosphate transport system permease protein